MLLRRPRRKNRRRGSDRALDDELLKDSGPDPLAAEPKARCPRMSRVKRKAIPKKPDASGKSLDQELLKGLGEGEDLGEERCAAPRWARLSREMRDVEDRISRQLADEDTIARQARRSFASLTS